MLKAEDNDNPAIDNPVNFKNFLLSNVTPLSSCRGSGVSTQVPVRQNRGASGKACGYLIPTPCLLLPVLSTPCCSLTPALFGTIWQSQHCGFAPA